MDGDIANQVGARIRMLRKARGLTQSWLARCAGKSVETISNMERGKTSPSLQTLAGFAKCLNVSLADFFESKPMKAGGTGVEAVPYLASLQPNDRKLIADIAKLMFERQEAGGKLTTRKSRRSTQK